MKGIRILCADLVYEAALNETDTADKILQACPIEGRVNTWGDEIYFSIPVELPAENGARADVAIGELGYWPPGRALCIFFGRTPASSGPEPQAASPVNVFGRIDGDMSALRRIREGEKVRVERIE